MKVDFYRHALSASDAAPVAAVLNTPFLTSASIGKQVEAQLCDYFAIEHALLCNSWTNGALACLLALEVGPDDEVIVPAMTFIATANVVELLGAKPVFVDVDSESLLITPEAIEAALSPRTKAVMPVHLYGQLCDMVAIQTLLKKQAQKIYLVEDCAHSFEARNHDARPGSHADAAIFSFYATKNITCGEGGAIITRDTGLYEKLLQTRLHGMSAGAAARHETGQYRHWDMLCLGAKANLPDLLAALLPKQIEAAEERLEERRLRYQRYQMGLSDLPLDIPKIAPHCTQHAHHLFAVGIQPPFSRDQVLKSLGAAQIGATVNYRSFAQMTYYQQKYRLTGNDFPIANDWGARTLSLPFYPDLPPDQQDYVIEKLREICSLSKHISND